MGTHSVVIVGLWLLTIMLVDRWRSVVSKKQFKQLLVAHIAPEFHEIFEVLQAALCSSDRHLRNKVQFVLQHFGNVHVTAKPVKEAPTLRPKEVSKAGIGFR